MRIDVVERPAVRVACMHYTGPPGEPLGRFWRGTVAPWLAEHGLVDCPRYGVSRDDPMSTPPEQCRYDAAVQIGVGLRTGPDVQVMDYEGGDYACMHFVGTGPEIAAAWAQMGAPGQIPDGWEWEPRAALEIYDEDFAVDPATGRFPCWLCIPIKRAG